MHRAVPNYLPRVPTREELVARLQELLARGASMIASHLARAATLFSIRRRTIELELTPWGGGLVSIDRVAVHHTRLLNPHTWAERREIGERQRSGGCGLASNRG